MTYHEHAKQQITYWLQLAKSTEDEYPGLFRRAEQELVSTGARVMEFRAAHRVALSYAEQMVTSESYRLGVAQGGRTPEDFADKMKISRLTAATVSAVNLRMTQQVYSFDPTLATALVEPEILKNDLLKDDEGAPLPVDFLMRMPFPTFVIVPNTLTIMSILVSSSMVPDGRGGEAFHLSINVRMQGEDGRAANLNSTLVLRPGQTLRQCVRDTIADQQRVFGDGVDAISDREVSLRLFEFALPLILYLCADNREVEGDTAQPPAVTKTKRGLRLFVPERVSMARVGVRIGSVMRKYQAARQATLGDGSGAGDRMPPHVRRQHWHTFWAGARAQPEARYRKLHFLPPIPVNIDTYDDLQPVVHPALP